MSTTYDNVENFSADYYLSRTANGTKLQTEENFTMIFPETDEQHGPIRELMLTNQAGKNLIAERSGLSLSAKMDGEDFPIAKTESNRRGNDFSTVFYLGRSSTYLHGEHTFSLSYDYKNVITEPASGYQEFYWNANGTSWDQTFSSLSARVHIADKNIRDAVVLGRTSCYVGRYGTGLTERYYSAGSAETGPSSAVYGDADFNSRYISERCTVTKTDDGLEFSTENLSKYEGLTFAIDFQPGTFAVPEPETEYNYNFAIFCSLGVAILIGLVIWQILRTRKKVHAKRELYHDTFVPPEYQPPEGLKIAEAEQLLMKRPKKSYIATLLDLAVRGKVQIIKGEPKQTLFGAKDAWKIRVINTDELSASEQDVLKLLTGKTKVPTVGTEISLAKRKATASLAATATDYQTSAILSLIAKGLFEKKTPVIATKSSSAFSAFGAWAGVGAVIAFVVRANLLEVIDTIEYSSPATVVFEGEFFVIILNWAILLAAAMLGILAVMRIKYSKYTIEGIKTERKLEGLKLYIGMAEVERLKFLQSVSGVEVSNAGLVKLYEKLLPWAALFGLEKSWISEMEKYYQVEEVSPTWCSSTDVLDAYAFSTLTRSIDTVAASSANYVDRTSGSSSGSSSGFSSGGGGGGFSGGGGGGGGGGRW